VHAPQILDIAGRIEVAYSSLPDTQAVRVPSSMQERPSTFLM
jgi:hypothetical protein